MFQVVEIDEKRRAAAVSRLLESRSPADTDARLVATLSRSCEVPLALAERTMIPETGPIYTVLTGVRTDGEVPPSKAKAALETLRLAMLPATPRDLAAGLAELKVLTAGRELDAVNAEIQGAAYVSRLSEYPADVALAALRKVRKFFPTWHELWQDCEAGVKARRLLIAHFERIVAEAERPKPAALEDRRVLRSRFNGPRIRPAPAEPRQDRPQISPRAAALAAVMESLSPDERYAWGEAATEADLEAVIDAELAEPGAGVLKVRGSTC